MFNPVLIALIPLLPFFSFWLIGLAGRSLFPKYGSYSGTLVILVSFILSAFVAWQYFTIGSGGMTGAVHPQIIVFNYTWLKFSPSLSINMGIMLDSISVMMIVIVTFISLMVHIFSLGYMKGERNISNYYCFLSLFTFSMLGLVLSTNIFQIYIFWELVGISSFLLIGFYYEKPAAVAASKKAFIITRFADLGFLIGILILSYYTKTLDFQTLIRNASTPALSGDLIKSSFLGFSALSWGLVLVFAGGAGKSAMFPFHIWLPDAMEGPTPVSALIHAATMVVAGVYIVARLFPVYSMACPGALSVVACTGAFTSLFAAIIACTQTDIKRVLAYSTISQIGYMMFALGVSGYSGEPSLGFTASMFHLFTHANFKALLFLGAGAIIHYVHSNEMGNMGGLRKALPVTHITFLIACLAIAGIPPFSGFFSKEEILMAAWNANKLIYYVGLLTAAITAFYIFRLYFNIFWHITPPAHGKGNEATGDSHARKNNFGRELPVTMLIPLIILGILSVVAGFAPFGKLITANGTPLPMTFQPLFSIAPVLLAAAGIYTAYVLYGKENNLPQRAAAALNGFYRTAYKKFYIDEVYLFITKKVIFHSIGKPVAWFDRNIIDRNIDRTGESVSGLSFVIRKLQSGKVQDYAIYIVGGAVGILFLFLYITS